MTTKQTAKKTGIKFKIKGKEQELKLNWEAVKTLHSMIDGGAFNLVGKAVVGDNETYTQVIFAGLLHTGEDYSLMDIDEALEEAFQKGKLTMSDIIKTLHTLILDNPYYKRTVDKMLDIDPDAKDALEKIRNL